MATEVCPCGKKSCASEDHQGKQGEGWPDFRRATADPDALAVRVEACNQSTEHGGSYKLGYDRGEVGRPPSHAGRTAMRDFKAIRTLAASRVECFAEGGGHWSGRSVVDDS